MAMAFFKAVNLVLFFRADLRLFTVYLVVCLGEVDNYLFV